VSEVRIRRAVVGDLAALVELENATFATDRMRARQWRGHLHSASAHVFIATRERRIAGAALVFFRHGSAIARLYSIAVAASERGAGIGAKLLHAAEQAALRRGCRALRLEVREDNAPAQRLYEQHGYRHFGMRRAYYEDGHSARRYEKTLKKG
jgi:ribosomal protein S18 acetylase RimI-like enzyme